MRASGAGIKMEGLLYLVKYGICGLEFAGITERRISNKGEGSSSMPVHEQGGLLSTARPLTSTNWNHPLASGFTRERRLLHPTTALRPSTNELVTD